MSGEDATQKLLADLDAACAEPSAAKRELHALVAVLEFMENARIEDRLQRPLRDHTLNFMDALSPRRYRGRMKPSTETLRYARAAATITFLNERGYRVDQATKEVSKAAGLDKQKLESFRDNVLRSLGNAKKKPANEMAVFLYRHGLKEMRADPRLTHVLNPPR